MPIDTIIEDTIPDTIREIEQWICWREKDRDGKATKIPTKPYRTSGTPNAKTDDPSHWRDFETALEYHKSGRIDTTGIGFVFSTETEIVGIDLDSCRDGETGEFDEWAQDVIERLDSFTEISPSGTGVHVLAKGQLPDGRNRRGEIEMYDEGRFFTVTGEHVEGTPQEIKHRQDAIIGVHLDYVQTDPTADDEQGHLEGHSPTTNPSSSSTDDSLTNDPRSPQSSRLHRGREQTDIRKRFDRDLQEIDDSAIEVALQNISPQKIPVPPPQTLEDLAGPGVPLDDREVIQRAYNSKSGEKIQQLYCGDPDLFSGADSEYPSQSEADMALLFYLGFWTGKDPEQMDRLFRDSELFREKWDDQHYGNGATYGAVCIAKTLLELTDYYEPPSENSSSQERQRPETEQQSRGHTSANPTRLSDRQPVPPSSAPAHSSHSAPEQSPSSGSEQAFPSDGQWEQDDHQSPPHSRSTQRERTGQHRPPFREVSIDIGAVEDARRLALKVTQQHEQLTEQAEYIAKLENRLYWYRQTLGVEPPASDDLNLDQVNLIDDSEQVENLNTVDPTGGPAAPPPQGSAEETLANGTETASPSTEFDDTAPPETDGGTLTTSEDRCRQARQAAGHDDGNSDDDDDDSPRKAPGSWFVSVIRHMF
ncbi:hypothetical protein ACOZ4N_01440 (plasmid) [Halorientalis pallida]|uniref:phage NrS-1 polymerase family protein n=1 Tax=Halorientalis pallida TaxID=2479928 RepID=UPI003C6F6DE6